MTGNRRKHTHTINMQITYLDIHIHRYDDIYIYMMMMIYACILMLIMFQVKPERHLPPAWTLWQQNLSTSRLVSGPTGAQDSSEQ